MKGTPAYTPVSTVHERDDGESTVSATAYAPLDHNALDAGGKESNPSKAAKKTRKCTSAFDNTEDNWLIEIICVVVGSVLIVALYLVLQAYDGKPAPRFGSSAFGTSLTLNTVVAIIAAAAKVLLLLPVAECVGQLRWIWFARRDRRLDDFAVFDSAVRGSMWSGFGLLWTTKMRSLASLGAFITLFAVAIDPLSQQLIAYSQDGADATDLNATVPVAVTYLEIGTNLDAVIGNGWKDLQNQGLPPEDYSYISVGMKSAIQSGFWNGNDRVAELPATCPGGNCTFAEYSTLAVCSSVVDVTEHLRETNNTLNKTTGLFQVRHQLTDDRYIVAYGQDKDDQSVPQGEINISSVATGFPAKQRNENLVFLDFGQSIAFKDLQHPLADIFVITRNGSTPTTPEERPMYGGAKINYAAFEVSLFWCIQNYTTEVINGTSTTLSTPAAANHNFTWHSGTQGLLNDAPHPGHPVRGWSVDGRHHASLQWHLKQLLEGQRTQAVSSGEVMTSNDVAQVLYDPFELLSYRTPKGNLSETLHQTERDGLRRIFDNVATSMTNRVRRMTTPLSEVAEDNIDPYVVNTANGTVQVQVTVVHIRWPWITAHICFALFSIGLLGATMLSHRASPLRGQEPWKSSGVAILHALEPALHGEMGGVVKMSEVQERSAGRVVRLEQVGGEGWRLVEVEGKTEEARSR